VRLLFGARSSEDTSHGFAVPLLTRVLVCLRLLQPRRAVLSQAPCRSG